MSVTGSPIDKLVADNPFYRVATIPGGMYKGTDGETTTFGVGATFVTSAEVSEDVVYVVAKSAPLHPGAEKAYKELGLMD